jgi:hypothetical protein
LDPQLPWLASWGKSDLLTNTPNKSTHSFWIWLLWSEKLMVDIVFIY